MPHGSVGRGGLNLIVGLGYVCNVRCHDDGFVFLVAALDGLVASVRADCLPIDPIELEPLLGLHQLLFQICWCGDRVRALEHGPLLA
jgi:hypothetical protein